MCADIDAILATVYLRDGARHRRSAQPVVKLHGQGPRAEVRAARGAPHMKRANARRVPP
jgi:hypothetical protein